MRHTYVTYCLRRAFLVSTALLFAAPVARVASAQDIQPILKGIEKRYNSAKTLEIGFTENYTAQGRKRSEAGTLYLRKPGRMRWDYRNPAGKLFISDGKDVYFYSPEQKRAEKLKLKETEDLRAPMAFLLGRLDFNRDFQKFQMRPEGPNTWITALPKSDKVPYRQVEFLATPDFRIERLIVAGQDASVLDFSFSDEKRNPAVNDAMFRFQLPPGAQYVDSSQSVGGDR